MKSEWEVHRLGDLISIQNGYAFDSTLFNVTSGLQLVRIRDLKNGFNTETRYSGDYDSRYVVKAGDYLVGMDGEFGCFEWKGEPSLLNQRVCRLEVFCDRLHARFLFFGLNRFLKEIEEGTTYTTVKHLSSKQILDIAFTFPPLPEQKRIVKILDEAFAGIATAKANAEKNLENARVIFESYIQNIEGVRQSLGRFVTIRTGKLDANKAVEGGIYPFFTCSREIFAINTYAFDCEAVLLAGNNAVGDFNVKHYSGKFNAYQRTYVITIDDTNALSYRYLFYQMQNSLKGFKSQAVGAGTKFLKIGMIKDLEIAVPTIAVQEQFTRKADAMLEESEKLNSVFERKIVELDALKKSILNEAFSGNL